MTRDPYRYFRIEARELLERLQHGVLAFERDPADREALRRMFRAAHTLKGAARVVGLAVVGDLAHRIEDRLATWREGATPDRAQVAAVLAELDAVARAVDALDAPPAPAGIPAAPSSASPDRTVRVPVEAFDRWIEQLFEVAAEIAEACRTVEALPGGSEAARRLADRLSTVRAGVDEVRVAAEELRLVPAPTLLPELERAARDAADQLGRTVEVRWEGEEVRADADVLATVRPALLHLVRNAVAHGIESPDARGRAGKPSRGLVRISAVRRGHRVVFACEDDGAGVDVDAVRDRLVRAGTLRPSADRATVLRHLVTGGVSTASGLSVIAGRGVGLDVVHAAARRLGGEVRLHTEDGRGTRVEIEVPITLAAVPVLAVGGDGRDVLIPLEAVRAAVRVQRRDLLRVGEGERLVFDGDAIPAAHLTDLTGGVSPVAAVPDRPLDAVILATASGRAALLVDRVGGVRRVVVRALPPSVRPDPVVGGACVEVDGPPSLVLAPDVLVVRAATARSATAPEPAPPVRILVVDDSLTSRSLVRGILESAGYEVDLAESAEEALEIARRRPCALFVVDVEMPGMDGFEFVATTRRDPALRDVPSIIVTSRGAPADIRRGREVGARAYLVKSAFDEAALLDAVRRLVG